MSCHEFHPNFLLVLNFYMIKYYKLIIKQFAIYQILDKIF
ncbi:hypothetical protein EJK51_1177 [Moraxella catarrhalis]|uniref:Uncharacterized protein n=1 Tax=Moraxella catarrhalis TaxID=480 RepID=A0A3S9QFM9_MORCA|nr:hypothetical protein MCR_1125 [Moraxella catarrhalis BBH18]AZQ86499.1 hypothetical protein EJK52_1179 [Moraxella catarrhalis]AZQ89311.1 hypothetical protein EJK50_1232 [Moraxella catarrhalis]AZQ90730.1 hypothetical protein EJK51_1177 [Moraxella catarrhalis]AZQ93537.1 hypothetical protein EJK53_1255 [Moraxella catarrhalis]